MFRYEALDAANKVLEERIAQMEDVARQADSVARENERLRKLLDLKATNEDYKLVDAYIIGWSSSDWESRVWPMPTVPGRSAPPWVSVSSAARRPGVLRT